MVDLRILNSEKITGVFYSKKS